MIKRQFLFHKKSICGYFLLRGIIASDFIEKRGLKPGDILTVKLQVESLNEQVQYASDNFDSVLIKLNKTNFLAPLDVNENLHESLSFFLSDFKLKNNGILTSILYAKVVGKVENEWGYDFSLFPDRLLSVEINDKIIADLISSKLKK